MNYSTTEVLPLRNQIIKNNLNDKTESEDQGKIIRKHTFYILQTFLRIGADYENCRRRKG